MGTEPPTEYEEPWLLGNRVRSDAARAEAARFQRCALPSRKSHGTDHDNWRSRNGSSEEKSNGDTEGGFQRHFHSRLKGTKPTPQYEVYNRSSNHGYPNRSAYNIQETNSFTRSRYHRQHSSYKPSGNIFTWDTRIGATCNAEYFNFTHLEQLDKMTSDRVIATLMKQRTEFEQFLNSTFTPDALVMTVRVLKNLCKGNFTENMTGILSRACSETFLKSLETYLMSLPFENESAAKKSNNIYWEDRNGFWKNLIEIFQTMVDLLPSKARDELPGILDKMNIIITSIENNQDYVIDKNVKTAALDMSNKLQSQLQIFEMKSAIHAKRPEELEESPPEDFRSLSIIPTKKDLLDSHPFIRINKVKEAYSSVEHYLDVQFRLLREDFIGPLRDGIDEYLNDFNQRRNKNLRIYKKVRFVIPNSDDFGVIRDGVEIFFGIKNNINWRDSKRLIFGGLLCLSNDNFNTILFATISHRDEKYLEKGILTIKPCGGTEITSEFYDSDFVMLEPKLYFEPYFVVLNAMLHMNERNFPMRNYLVDADTSTFRPRYINSTYLTFGETIFSYKGIELPVASNRTWPSAQELNLDEMQYKAFKSALTQELVLIQGPPGTGKTFLALQIIRTILENREYWLKHGPVMVVCLTNHALDQILDGILKYTDSIVRVGSRSSNPRLEQCSIKNKRSNSFIFSDSARNAQSNMHFAKRKLQYNIQEIKETCNVIENLTQENSIVSVYELQKYCRESALYELNNQDLLKRLFGFSAEYITVEQLLKHRATLRHKNFEWKSNLVEPVTRKNSTYSTHELDMPWQTQLFSKLFFSLGLCEFVIPLECIDELIHENYAQMHLCTNEMSILPFNPTTELEYDITELRKLRSKLQQQLAQHPLLTTEKNRRPQHPNWEEYWRWITISYENAMSTLAELKKRSGYLLQELKNAKEYFDLEILQEHEVIGITTTAAARLHTSIRALHAPIVLVEEAAEILEAHVVCSLTKSCQHLILVGDHKQLRPKAAVHKLGTKYNLNISLFERMINIHGDYTQLTNQHRMRPEIAALICPSIYDTLYNHESVCAYPPIEGVSKNLFFLHHEHKEVSSDHNDDTWTNPHEAKFLVAFARHLILQGYDVSEITIVCTYAGQLFVLIKERERYSILRNLRITTIDNYQGEENKIILLSLVRNNEEGNVGFLSEENRVCVALSRARAGLYIMGNMHNLTTNNHIWPKIKNVLENDNAIGDCLELQCQIHPDELLSVQSSMDFQKSPEGGCLRKCDTKLSCGHTCLSVCHVLDRKHVAEHKCHQPCRKACPKGHPCPFTCSQTCKDCLVFEDRELKCGHTVPVPCWVDSGSFLCPVMVNGTLPDCNHTVVKPCHKSVKDYPCSYPCDVRVPCGHSCELNCHVNDDPDHLTYMCQKECTKTNLNCTMNHVCKKQCSEKCILCDIKMKKERSCGHYFDCLCSEDVEGIVCNKPCKRDMDCGHKCQLKCSEICGKCQVIVEKTSTCGHNIKLKCCEEATSSKCSNECKLKLACGHPCKAKCKDPCTTACKLMVRRSELGLCGHNFSVPCYLQGTRNLLELLKYCKEPCMTELACGHICKGNCGYCKQGRIHTPCGEICGNILVCGHKCEVPCRQECPPCKKVCEVKCRHNRCNKKCGEPCTPCKEKCGWGCSHSKCTKSCSELCDREPCNEECPKLLKCGHPCVGFCGEPCPPLCRICNKEELIDEFFFGNEDEPNARFILLEDCGHCIESEGLLKWVSERSDPIQMKTCPRCKTFISKCMRIMNQIKTDVADVQAIKKKIFGDQTCLLNQQQLFVKEIKRMQENRISQSFPDLNNFLKILHTKVFPMTKKKRRQVLDVRATEATKITLNILQHVIEKLENIDPTITIYPWLNDQVVMLVQSLSIRGQISNQEINDIEKELQRLHYMAEICKMNLQIVFQHNDTVEHEIDFINLVEKLTSVHKFTEERELDIKNQIHLLTPLLDMKKVILMDNERKMIVKAMGYKQGHWFKCPNGHIYTIGDCGGAMEESNCNECGAAIGGGSHRLRSDNSLATDMDGATRPAWPL
ncbi:NFX1-type zinc finger-containing protein 1 isoform X1 [Neodiprion lecontei]|uniref:NFX1-type zinc finger-containing protein 1 isoform X1 n=1 Tax=Neodiprion lecontei TaxID=441921 RepID=A0ABM3FNC7_NEOLC|nr:NFX1-type zinc finger-containing protein 1 isoform X1 [Neodiprion lecontei]